MEPVAKVNKCYMDDRYWFDIDPLLSHDQYHSGQLLYTHPSFTVEKSMLKRLVTQVFGEGYKIVAPTEETK